MKAGRTITVGIVMGLALVTGNQAGAAVTATLVAMSGTPNVPSQPGWAKVTDGFGRSYSGRTIPLLDWEGYMANPAVEVTVAPPADAEFPATAVVSGDHHRLYFDTPSTVAGDGPSKALHFSGPAPETFSVAIFPDRDGAHENHALRVVFSDPNGSSTLVLPVRVEDQDRPGRGLAFRIHPDFSRDRQGYNWFADSQRRTIARQAATDWSYFVADMDLETVGRGEQLTHTSGHPCGFHAPAETEQRNGQAYTGFLAYIYGIRLHPSLTPGGNLPFCPPGELRSGGAPEARHAEQVQRSGDSRLHPRLWRSGTVEMEMAGNYDQNGWRVETDSSRWYELDNRDENDLYSILRHELGHAIAFNTQYPAFTRNGMLTSTAIQSYLGQNLPINDSDHFAGIVDPASGYGAFGNEYNGEMPARRWLPTKLDLLALEAIGYELRNTTALRPLAVGSDGVAPATVGEGYSGRLTARGAVPPVQWRVDGLPAGLALDGITGRISGTALRTGRYPLQVRLCDSHPDPGPAGRRCVASNLVLQVQSPGAECRERCDRRHADCLADDHILPRQCVQMYRQCTQACPL